jgi:hypothetical protein
VNSSSPGWFPAAEACWRYNPLRHYAATSADTRQGEWYLPSAGELGYIIPRLSVLNRIISAINTGYGHTVALQIERAGYAPYFTSTLCYNDYVVFEITVTDSNNPWNIKLSLVEKKVNRLVRAFTKA